MPVRVYFWGSIARERPRHGSSRPGIFQGVAGEDARARLRRKRRNSRVTADEITSAGCCGGGVMVSWACSSEVEGHVGEARNIKTVSERVLVPVTGE